MRAIAAVVRSHAIGASLARLAGLSLLSSILLTACSSSSPSSTSPPPLYTAFTNPTAVTIRGYTGDAMEPFISKDGHYLFFNSRNDPSVNTDLFYASRIDDETFMFLGPIPGVNSPQLDAVPSLDTAGHLYFVSTRSYDATLSTIYSGQFTPSGVTGVALIPGVSRDKAGSVNFDAEISADGQTLWFDDGQYSASGLQAAAIVMATRQGGTFVRAPNSSQILATVNASGLNYAPDISVDGRELFFTRIDPKGAGATPVIYRATRPDVSSPFGAIEQVAGAAGFVEAPSLSADGHVLYYHKNVNGAFAIYVLRR